jgi:hypothetical protein
MSSHDERVANWRARFAAHGSSGLSVTDWCASEGIPVNNYYYWRKRVSLSTSASAPGWIPLTPADLKSPVLTLRVGRVSVDVAPDFDPCLLRRVLATLEA